MRRAQILSIFDVVSVAPGADTNVCVMWYWCGWVIIDYNDEDDICDDDDDLTMSG